MRRTRRTALLALTAALLSSGALAGGRLVARFEAPPIDAYVRIDQLVWSTATSEVFVGGMARWQGGQGTLTPIVGYARYFPTSWWRAEILAPISTDGWAVKGAASYGFRWGSDPPPAEPPPEDAAEQPP